MIKVSVIVPAYNAENTLAETLESVLVQTYRNFEIVIVDDGSTDRTADVASVFTNSEAPVRLINQDNQGLAAARNAAISWSVGEFILPLDADDRISHKYLEKTVPLLDSHASIGFVSTGIKYFGGNDVHIPVQQQTYQAQLRANQIPVCSLVRKKAIESVGGYKSDAPGWEDWMLWLDILKAGWFMFPLNEPLFYYRRRMNSMADNAWANRKKLGDWMRKHHPQFTGDKA